jgi:hypothetical protein
MASLLVLPAAGVPLMVFLLLLFDLLHAWGPFYVLSLT